MSKLLSYGDQLVLINSSLSSHTMFIPVPFLVRSSSKHGTGGGILGFSFAHAGPFQREKFVDYCFPLLLYFGCLNFKSISGSTLVLTTSTSKLLLLLFVIFLCVITH